MENETGPEQKTFFEGIEDELFGEFRSVAGEAEQLISTKPETPTDLQTMEVRLKEIFEAMKERYITKLPELDEPTKARIQEQWELVYNEYHSLLNAVMTESSIASGEMKRPSASQ